MADESILKLFPKSRTTPEISELYRLATRKKDTEVSENSLMVLHVGKSFHSIREEIDRWRDILAAPYREYLDISGG